MNEDQHNEWSGKSGKDWEKGWDAEKSLPRDEDTEMSEDETESKD